MTLTKEQLIAAAEHADWIQASLNSRYGTSPCFHLEEGRFCLRGKNWGGHGVHDFHEFVPLEGLLREILK